VAKKNGLNIRIDAFMDWYEINRVDHTKYVRLSSVKNLFVGRKKAKD
jgi:hypothetical protein